MSVILLETEQYVKVLNTLTFYGYIDRMSMKKLYTLEKHKVNFEKCLPDLIKTWYELNEKTYNIKYGESFNLLNSELKTTSRGAIKDNIHLLKALECIFYQIEKGTIENIMPLTEKENLALQILKEAISELQAKIVSELPEYNEAPWSNF